MSTVDVSTPYQPIQFGSVDPEARFGLPIGTATTPSSVTCLLLTVTLSGVMYGFAYAMRGDGIGVLVWQYMTGFAQIPIPVIVLSTWCMVFLVIKALKIRTQRLALRILFVPEDSGFVLTDATAGSIVDAIDRSVDDPMRFIFLARCRAVLRMMRNLGRVSDVDEILNSRADQDEASMDSGYTILRGFVWAIPVLGFIGTVVGLTQSMGKFGEAMEAAGADVGEITARLKTVLEGLDTAFITTAEALVAVLIIYIFQTFVRRADEHFLDEVRAACANVIVARVRISRKES